MPPAQSVSPASTVAPALPRQVTLLDVPLAVIDYEETLDWIDAAVEAGAREYVCVAAVHTVMAATRTRSCGPLCWARA